ncbi:MAG: HDIG domain-containing protein [Prevotella sp.]|nr:HDIG domain-containing protein [Candidatus Prevotella equi]
MDYQNIIDRFFPDTENQRLREILITHSKSVAELAVQICRNHPELNADEDFVYGAAMLHDIGIVKCDADGISCYGTEPYICHGTLGAQMLRDMNVDERYARVCERHTGTGLTAESIRKQHLPLPEKDLIPQTIEEKIVCYADKFFSKTHLDRQKTYEGAERSLAKFGEEGVLVFREWHNIFG